MTPQTPASNKRVDRIESWLRSIINYLASLEDREDVKDEQIATLINVVVAQGKTINKLCDRLGLHCDDTAAGIVMPTPISVGAQWPGAEFPEETHLALKMVKPEEKQKFDIKNAKRKRPKGLLGAIFTLVIEFDKLISIKTKNKATAGSTNNNFNGPTL